MSSEFAVVLFDGDCRFCNASVQFIIKRDPKKRFRFASLQSEVGRDLASQHGVDAAQLDGLVLIEDGKASIKSTAALRIARRLTWPWPVFWLLLAVPRFLRDWCYDRFAAMRYRFFGRRDHCMRPDSDDAARYLDVQEMKSAPATSADVTRA